MTTPSQNITTYESYEVYEHGFWEVHAAIVTQQLFDPTGVLSTGVYMSCRRAGKVLGVMGPYPSQRFAGGAEQGSGDERAA